MRGLKYLRTSKELTQSQVAVAVGLTQSHYAKLEKGLVQPRTLVLVKLARLFEVSLETLL